MNRAQRKFTILAVAALIVLSTAMCRRSAESHSHFTPPTGLPDDFSLHHETFGGIGGGRNRSERQALSHYPVIFVSDNRCDPLDWTGRAAEGSNCLTCDTYDRFRANGFLPIELWLLRILPAGTPMDSLENHTDDLRRFIYSVLHYTGAPKIQILAHGAGAALSHWTMKKYNLYDLVHAAIYIAGPMHGTGRCDWFRCLESDLACCSLTPGSDFIRDLVRPVETPYSVTAGRGNGFRLVKYMTFRNGVLGGDWWYPDNPDSPMMEGAINRVLPDLDHHGLRCSEATTDMFIPFLSDPASSCLPEHDRDRDGFCSRESGGNDCNDSESSVFPGAKEICEDGVDQDCNGFDFHCTSGRDVRTDEER